MEWGFFGQYIHALDAKNRVNIPSKLLRLVDPKRDGRGLWITKGFERCLFAFTPAGWESFRRQLEAQPPGKREVRQVQRHFLGGADYQMPDKQGRVLLADPLRQWGGLVRDVMIVGLDARIEIWDMQRWKEYEQASAGQIEAAAEALS